jgi:uncharacterized protein involved in exopolysaccharide biosynthesis
MNPTDFSNQNIPVSSRGAGSQALQSERLLLVKEANPTNNLRDYLSILFKHKISIIAVLLFLSITGITFAFLYHKWGFEPKYEARSSLLVKLGWEAYSPDLSLENRRSNVGLNEIMGSEMSILQSRELKEKVINALKPETIFPQLLNKPFQGLTNSDAALVLFDKQLFVRSGARGNNIIEVAFDGSNPGSAAAVVNQLVNFYIDKRSEIYRDPKSILFLEKKTEEYRQKLAESEGRLKAFRDETKIVSFDEQRTMLLKQRLDLIAALNGTSNEMRELQEKIAELEKQLSSLPKTAVTAAASERAVDADARLLNLQLQEQELLAKYKEDNRLVTNIRGQIEMVRQFLEKNSVNKSKPGVAPPDPVYQDIQKQILSGKAELGTLKVRYADTEKQLGDVAKDLQVFEGLEVRSKELTREVADNQEKYSSYRQRLEEARVHDELDRQKMTSVSVIEPAGVPIAPINGQRPLVLLIAAAIGVAIAGSFGLAYVRELAKQVMSTAMEAEKRLDLPVLVTIPIKN